MQLTENEFFFCLNCHVTAELDKHGRCATCGSDAVTYPGTYQLFVRRLEAAPLSGHSGARPSSFTPNEALDRHPHSTLLTAGISNEPRDISFDSFEYPQWNRLSSLVLSLPTRQELGDYSLAPASRLQPEPGRSGWAASRPSSKFRDARLGRAQPENQEIRALHNSRFRMEEDSDDED